jgi:hypothetical protein
LRINGLPFPGFGLHRAFTSTVDFAQANLNSEMAQTAKPALASSAEDCVAELACFFPQAIAVRIPVQVCRTGEVQVAAETTMIEYGTAQEVLFASGLSLEFEERLRLRNSDGTLDVEVEIAAMQLHHGKAAVAARFLEKVPNWIIKK